jgi:hypothetical protein
VLCGVLSFYEIRFYKFSVVGFEVLTAAVVNVAIFRDIAPCSLTCIPEHGNKLSVVLFVYF